MLRTFPKGGIHPPENKLTSTKPIKRLPVPKVVYVPISQHIGIPAEIIVDRKDKVEIGQVIAKSGGFVSSNIHTPVAGTVTKLDKPSIHMSMLIPLLLMAVGFKLYYITVMLMRARCEVLDRERRSGWVRELIGYGKRGD